MKPSDLLKWKKSYTELNAFFDANGHSRVPYRDKMNPSLGAWVSRQRNKADKLNTKQINQLNKLNFVWSDQIRKDRYQYFTQMFRKLQKYKLAFGNCIVPSKFKEDEKLGRWVETLRLYEKNGKLEDWKKIKLDEIGFIWSNQIQNQKIQHWYDMYSKLEIFFEKYRHSNVPEYWNEDPALSIWVMSQRRPKKPLKMEKRLLLQKLKFKFKFFDTTHRKRDENGVFVNAVENIN